MTDYTLTETRDSWDFIKGFGNLDWDDAKRCFTDSRAAAFALRYAINENAAFVDGTGVVNTETPFGVVAINEDIAAVIPDSFDFYPECDNKNVGYPVTLEEILRCNDLYEIEFESFLLYQHHVNNQKPSGHAWNSWIDQYFRLAEFDSIEDVPVLFLEIENYYSITSTIVLFCVELFSNNKPKRWERVAHGNTYEFIIQDDLEENFIYLEKLAYSFADVPIPGLGTSGFGLVYINGEEIYKPIRTLPDAYTSKPTFPLKKFYKNAKDAFIFLSNMQKETQFEIKSEPFVFSSFTYQNTEYTTKTIYYASQYASTETYSPKTLCGVTIRMEHVIYNVDSFERYYFKIYANFDSAKIIIKETVNNDFQSCTKGIQDVNGEILIYYGIFVESDFPDGLTEKAMFGNLGWPGGTGDAPNTGDAMYVRDYDVFFKFLIQNYFQGDENTLCYSFNPDGLFASGIPATTHINTNRIFKV